MYAASPILQYALICSIALLSAHKFLVRWQRREKARKFGCRPIVKHPQAGLVSSDYDRQQKQAWGDGAYLKWTKDQYDKCGSPTYEVHAASEVSIMSSDVANQQAVSTNLSDWARLSRTGGKPFFGSSIMTQNGSTWRQTRGLINPLFKDSETSVLENFKGFVDIMILLIPRNGDTIDMQPLLRKLIIDSSTEYIFGESLGSLCDITDKSDKFIQALNRATAGAGKRIRPSGLISKLYAMGTWDTQWLKDIKVVHDFIDGCIERHRSADQGKLGLTERHASKRYLLIDGMSEAFQDPIELRFQLLGIFSLARETVAMTVSNILFLLARHPHIWTQLRKEALTLDEITYERLKSLSLFRYTVLETLRLRNPAPMYRRQATHDLVLPSGGGPGGLSPAFVPKGMNIMINKYPIWVDPHIWGEDAEDFRPERFEGRRLNTWEFMPFNGGPQACPASQQVVMQCIYLLVRLTREFQFIECRDPCMEYVESAQMCIESRNGCKIALLV